MAAGSKQNQKQGGSRTYLNYRFYVFVVGTSQATVRIRSSEKAVQEAACFSTLPVAEELLGFLISLSKVRSQSLVLAHTAI